MRRIVIFSRQADYLACARVNLGYDERGLGAATFESLARAGFPEYTLRGFASCAGPQGSRFELRGPIAGRRLRRHLCCLRLKFLG